jgi:hypothetical protein
MARWWIPVLGLAGCAFALGEVPDERNCEDRQAFYPDADGDGWGEPTSVYIGCRAPDGWVASLAPTDTGDTGTDTGDTDPPGDTGDTDPGDTGDTDAGDDTGDSARGASPNIRRLRQCPERRR